MDIRIDYLTYTEQVNISNDSTDKAAWKSLYSFICDYLPMSVVSYSDWSITFPWRYFLSIKGFVGQYFSARHNQYRVVFTDNAKSMLKTANDTSYNTALALNATKSWDNFCSHLFIKNPALPVVARRLFAAIKSDIICCSIKNITAASLVTF